MNVKETDAISDLAWERMVRSVQKVHDRLWRAATVLKAAKISFAMVGDQAVGLWVASVDESAVRYSQRIEILICRADFSNVRDALASAEFVHHTLGLADLFVDAKDPGRRNCIHIACTDRVENIREFGDLPVLNLSGLLQMMLAFFGTNDCVNVRDLIEVGLVDATWCARLPAELATQLQSLLDTPDG